MTGLPVRARQRIGATAAVLAVGVLVVSAARGAASDPVAVSLFDCRPAGESGFTIPHERLLWIPPAGHFDERLPDFQPHPEEPGVVELRFGAKLGSATAINCGGDHTDLIASVELGRRLVLVRLRGRDVRWRVARHEHALLVWSPRAVSAAISRQWPGPQAEALLAEARELGMAPENVDDLARRLAAARRRTQGFDALRAGRFASAAADLQAAFEAVPSDLEAGLALVRARYKLARYDDAEELLELLATEAPHSAEVRHEQGLLALSRHHPLEAEAHFRAAAEGDWPNAYFYLGFLAFEAASDQAATGALDHFLALNTGGSLMPRARRMLSVIQDRQAAAVRAAQAATKPPPALSRPPAARPPAPATATKATATKARARPAVVAKPPLYARPLVLDGLDRKDLHTASLAGHPAVLHLWATWCPPCRAEMPSLMRFARDRLPAFTDRGLSLVAVSMDYTEDELAGAAKAWSGAGDGILPPMYWDPNWLLAERLGLGSALPQTVLVAADGTVVAVLVGAQDWNDQAFQARLEALVEQTGG